jgi:hypothetical protein
MDGLRLFDGFASTHSDEWHRDCVDRVTDHNEMDIRSLTHEGLASGVKSAVSALVTGPHRDPTILSAKMNSPPRQMAYKGENVSGESRIARN